MTRHAAWLLAAVGGVAAIALYATRLAWSPVYLNHDEMAFLVNANAIATTGRDLEGVRWPLYIHIMDAFWAQPLVIYWPALFVKLVGLSETTARLATVTLGLLDLVLLFAIARRLFKRDGLALLAAALLALTPAHFIHARLGVDYLYPVPLVLAWLWCVLTYLEDGRVASLFGAGLCLGVGFYSYIASIVMMPMYVAISIAAIALWGRERRALGVALLVLGFLLVLLPIVPWLWQHPTVYAEEVRRYHLADPSAASARTVLNYSRLTSKVSLYWAFFDPSYLFLFGGSNVTNATGRSGVFLLPIAVFLAAGLVAVSKDLRNPAVALVAIGFLTAPVAALLLEEPFAIDRELELLPFAVLIATIGISRLYAAGARARVAVIGLLVLMPVQFLIFYADYMSGYRIRSAHWFEGNLRGAIETTIALDRAHPAPVVYVGGIPRARWPWKLYTTMAGYQEVDRRTRLIEAPDLEGGAPPGSLMLIGLADKSVVAAAARAGFRTVREVPDADGVLAYSVLER